MDICTLHLLDYLEVCQKYLLGTASNSVISLVSTEEWWVEKVPWPKGNETGGLLRPYPIVQLLLYFSIDMWEVKFVSSRACPVSKLWWSQHCWAGAGGRWLSSSEHLKVEVSFVPSNDLLCLRQCWAVTGLLSLALQKTLEAVCIPPLTPIEYLPMYWTLSIGISTYVGCVCSRILASLVVCVFW